MRVSATKRSRKHCSSQHYSLKTLIIATLLIGNIGTIHLGIIHWQICLCILFCLSLYKHLRACTDFLGVYGKWTFIHELSIIQYKYLPLLILRLGKILCVSWISATHTNWDYQCSAYKKSSKKSVFSFTCVHNICLPFSSPWSRCLNEPTATRRLIIELFFNF